MLSAILVAMIGLHFLRATEKIQFQVKPTKVASNIVGGLIFGVGFACAGYCPGTGAAGLGQGDLPALFFMAGLVAGSYLYAESSGLLRRTIDKWGAKGKLTLLTALRINAGASVVLFAGVIFGALIFLNRMNL
jgi:uncharacterized membrane protein YedE/YeeE